MLPSSITQGAVEQQQIRFYPEQGSRLGQQPEQLGATEYFKPIRVIRTTDRIVKRHVATDLLACLFGCRSVFPTFLVFPRHLSLNASGDTVAPFN